MNFRAGSAWTVWTFAGSVCGPEIFRFAEVIDAFGVETDLIVPDTVCLLVIFVDRHAEVRPVKTQLVSNEFPRPLDRLFFEVVPEGEVPEHLEEGQVIRCGSHFLDVTGPEAFLAACGARYGGSFRVLKIIFELVHSRAGKQEGGVSGWNEAIAVMPLVPALLEKRKKSLSEFRRVHEL